MSSDMQGRQPDVLMELLSTRLPDDPIPAYRRMHEECPVVRSLNPIGEYSVALTLYEDVLWALKHPEVFSSEDVVKIGNEVPLIPLSVDPPDHAKYRRLMDPQFSPKKMAELEPEMRRLVNEVIDGFVGNGTCDFHEDFATPLPSTFFLALLGLPQSDLPMFLQWRDNTIRPNAKTDAEAAEIRERTGHEITDYFRIALEERRRDPDSRLLTTLVQGEVDGRSLTEAELLGACHLLLLGGLDTVTATLDCMIVYLARHPDRRDALTSDFSLVPAVVEELLRLETPVMMLPRKIVQDVEIGGVECKAGDSATLLVGAADCDPAEFERHDEAVFDRERNRHLAFGGGPHRCLGSHLARLELRVAIEEWHRRIPAYAIADGAEIHYSGGIRQADNLPLVFAAGGHS
ncbi:MAG: cytochrome P450 [Actinomycetota bacterium]